MNYCPPASRFLAAAPLLPALAGIIFGVWLTDAFGFTHLFYSLVLGALLAATLKRTSITILVLSFLSAYFLHGLRIADQNSWLTNTPKEIEVTGLVKDTGISEKGPYLFEVFHTPNNVLPDGVHLVLITPRNETSSLKLGDLFSTRGRLEVIPNRRNPYGFDLATWRHRQGADLRLVSADRIQHHGVNPFSRPVRIMKKWRDHFREKITIGLEPESRETQIIRAVVLGEKPPSTADNAGLVEQFRLSGTLHVFAVSGLHIGMVTLILNFSLSWLCLPRLPRILAVILGMFLYAGITGFHPPAVRAVIMGAVIMGGFLLKRKPAILNSLALSACIVLLWDGHQLFTPSFQLSYGVLLSIALLSKAWSQLLSPLTHIDPFMPHSLLNRWQTMVLARKGWLKNALSVSLSAATGSTPLVWIHFGVMTPISIIAGIPLMFIVFAILATAMLSLSLGSIVRPTAGYLNKFNAFTAKSAYQTAHFFAEIPGGHWRKTPPRPKNGRVIIFDMPYGGAANLIDLGGGVLLDSGRADHFNRHVLPTITALGIQPDSLIITHADSLHSGGMSDCLQLFQPQQTLIPRHDQRSPSYKSFKERAHSLQHPLIIPKQGQKFPIEKDVYLEILHAPYQLMGRGKADDSGLVIRLHWQGWRILFTGDAGIQTENRMLETVLDLSADVIVMGRNQYDFTGSQAFYRAVAPSAIITSHALFPEKESPSNKWENLMKTSSIQVFDQLVTGAVTMTLANDQLTLSPTLKGVTPLVLKH